MVMGEQGSAEIADDKWLKNHLQGNEPSSSRILLYTNIVSLVSFFFFR